MKINVEFDLTPEEFRESLGLPNLEAFQRNMMDRIQQQMEAGVAGYDPWSLMKPFMQSGSQSLNQGLNQGLSQGMANFGNYQQMMMDMFRQAGSNAMASSSSKKEDSQKEDSKKKDDNDKEGETSSTRSGSANSSRSASSRSSGSSRTRKTQS
nr:hypothetical protein [uncultured Halomonas sp.]